jgi:hypothetical protein
VLTGVWAQKYNFVNLNVEHGLIQSQANALCQDQQGHLWIATMGGISRYDGQHFTGFSMNDGLANNIPFAKFLPITRGKSGFVDPMHPYTPCAKANGRKLHCTLQGRCHQDGQRQTFYLNLSGRKLKMSNKR